MSGDSRSRHEIARSALLVAARRWEDVSRDSRVAVLTVLIVAVRRRTVKEAHGTTRQAPGRQDAARLACLATLEEARQTISFRMAMPTHTIRPASDQIEIALGAEIYHEAMPTHELRGHDLAT